MQICSIEVVRSVASKDVAVEAECAEVATPWLASESLDRNEAKRFPVRAPWA